MSKKPSKAQKGGPFEGLAALKKQLAEEEAKKKGPAKGAGAPPAYVPPRKSKAKVEDPATSAEDALAFHRLMGNVVPLDQTHGRVSKSWVPEPSPGAEAARRRQNAKSAVEEEAQAVHEHLRTLVEGDTRFEVADDGTRVEGRRMDLPPDALRRLRRGLLPIDARIDLHGLRSEEARETLERFLREKRARGERCVLVVHGKGVHSPAQTPVLRGEISAWLSQGRASEHVAGFSTATENDGGEGAVYVLLRR